MYKITIKVQIIVVNDISYNFGQKDFLSISQKFSPLGSSVIFPPI